MIGTTLQRLISEKGTNVNELSRIIDVSAQTLYSIIKRDNMKIDFDVLLRICEALEVDIDVFYKDYIKSIPPSVGLDVLEYPIMAKYRRLNDSGKEYIDAQLDFALSQEKYKAKTPLATEQAEVLDDVGDLVDVSFAASGGESGTFKITRKEYEEGKELYDAYDYRTDK